MMPLRRLWLLFLREYYGRWSLFHLEMAERNRRKRSEVLHQLSIDDEEEANENYV